MSDRDPAAGTPAGPPEEDPRIRGERHPIGRMIALGIVASLVGIAICLAIDWFPQSASGSADKIDTVYDVLLICSVPVFVLVMTVAIYSVVRFRAMPGDMRDGAPIHGNTRLEVFWVTIPFLMVTALAIYGWIVLDDIEAKQPNTLVVNVTGQQFTWSFDYPGEKVNSTELVLPKDRPVEFRIHTKDVLHSFWVPEFRLKSDAVPGLTTKIRVTPNRVGHYQVVCAELCGLGHATMRQNVRVVAPSSFTSWLDKQKQSAGGGGASGGATSGGGGGAPDGAAIFAANGCGSCHTFKPANATGKVGPDLDNIDKPTAAFIRESIVDPNKVITKGFAPDIMPQDFGDKLSPEELNALVEYLLKAQK
ncbi:MAG: cytochrome c oxidase subunit [Thermoleophilaceae bacterium]|jgi:cytochrome c oxidase subunit 2|nr:cytochrome c oxidase subunit [Thermoleophilaceae bacterium]